MSKTPSAILTDALAAFNKAATLALTTAQEHARKDLTQATTDAREARRERDEAVKTLHASRLEEQAWKQEASVWKAAADQAELTISHHLETIAQLRQEATQWKNQCLRLEETSRQEAISWKEQFLRVEQERTKLAQRVEELVAEQLAGGHAPIPTAPYTPMVRYPALGDISASARQQPSRESLSPSLELPPSKSASSFHKPTSGVSRSRPGTVHQLPTPISENQRSARQRAAHESAPPISHQGSNGTRQILIRRVQAVVEVPVKEESADQEMLPPHTQASTSMSNHASTSASASTSISAPPSKNAKAPARTAESKAATRIKRKASAKRAYVEIDDDESERDDVSQASKQSDAEDANSDDDDELLMGVEANRKEVYGMKRVSKPISFPKTPSRGPPNTAKKRKVPPSSNKSRPSTTSKV